MTYKNNSQVEYTFLKILFCERIKDKAQYKVTDVNKKSKKEEQEEEEEKRNEITKTKSGNVLSTHMYVCMYIPLRTKYILHFCKFPKWICK